MKHEQPFFGRRDELRRWTEVLASPEGQAVLVVGQQGMGKTVLVNRMAKTNPTHLGLRCGAVRYEVVPTDAPEMTMELMLDHAFEAAQVEAGSFDGTPQRSKQWGALIALLPKGRELHELMDSLRRDPKRPVREQFIERLELIARRMPENGRAVFVIDPEKYMPDGSADTWRLVVQELPAKIKFVFAQRSDGRLVTNPDFVSLPNVVRIPGDHLDVLDEEAVEGLIGEFGPRIDHPPESIWQAVARYNRHPYAVPAALALLADGVSIAELPPDPTPEGIAAEQWKRIADRGPEAIRLFRACAVLEVAVPDALIDPVAEIDSATRQHLLAVDYLGGLLRPEAQGRRIYHSLLADHVLGQLPDEDARALHQSAIEVYRKRIESDVKPDELAVTRLPQHVLAAEGEQAFVFSFANECWPLLQRLGLFDTCLTLSHRALKMVEPESQAEAVLLGDLGLIYFSRGDLDRAEQMLRKSLEIDEKLARLEGMARGYDNLGLIYRIRGDLDRAEQMHRKSLEIDEKLGRLEGMANVYGNLGLIYRTRGDLDRGEQMHRKSLEINEKLGCMEGMASNYGNLGAIYLTRGDLDRAEQMFRKSLEIDEKLGRLEGMANSYTNLGRIAEKRGDISGERELWTKAHGLFQQIGMPHMVERMQGLLDRLPPENRP